MKKADLSINVIIMAVLGIVVLIVLVLIFTGKVRIFSSNVEGTCTDQGGKCLSSNQVNSACPEGYPLKKWTSGCSCYEETSGACTNQKLGQCCLPLLR